MRVARVHAKGGPSVISVDKGVKLPEKLGPHQIRIRNESIGVNFIDTYHRGGLYDVEYPFTLGVEGAGVVTEAGSESRFQQGDRVAYQSLQGGGYAEQIILDDSTVSPIPDAVSFDTAAAVTLQGLTAHYLAMSLPVKPLNKDSIVVVHAAAGGTGQLLTQILNRVVGCTVIGTASSKEKCALAISLGAKRCVHYDDLASAVREEVGEGKKGVEVVFDGVGKKTFQSSLSVLRPRGLMVSFGNASGAVPPVSPLELSSHGSLYLSRPKLGDFVQTPEELRSRMNDVLSWLADGKIKVNIDRVFGLGEARKAHEYIEGGKTKGKILLNPSK